MPPAIELPKGVEVFAPLLTRTVLATPATTVTETVPIDWGFAFNEAALIVAHDCQLTTVDTNEDQEGAVVGHLANDRSYGTGLPVHDEIWTDEDCIYAIFKEVNWLTGGSATVWPASGDFYQQMPAYGMLIAGNTQAAFFTDKTTPTVMGLRIYYFRAMVENDVLANLLVGRSRRN